MTEPEFDYLSWVLPSDKRRHARISEDSALTWCGVGATLRATPHGKLHHPPCEVCSASFRCRWNSEFETDDGMPLFVDMVKQVRRATNCPEYGELGYAVRKSEAQLTVFNFMRQYADRQNFPHEEWNFTLAMLELAQ